MAFDGPCTIKKASPASQVMEELSQLASRANDMAARVEETFGPVIHPVNPIPKSDKCMDAPRELFPPYFEEIGSRLSDITRSLDRIESVANRCGL